MGIGIVVYSITLLSYSMKTWLLSSPSLGLSWWWEVDWGCVYGICCPFSIRYGREQKLLWTWYRIIQRLDLATFCHSHCLVPAHHFSLNLFPHSSYPVGGWSGLVGDQGTSHPSSLQNSWYLRPETVGKSSITNLRLPTYSSIVLQVATRADLFAKRMLFVNLLLSKSFSTTTVPQRSRQFFALWQEPV